MVHKIIHDLEHSIEQNKPLNLNIILTYFVFFCYYSGVQQTVWKEFHFNEQFAHAIGVP